MHYIGERRTLRAKLQSSSRQMKKALLSPLALAAGAAVLIGTAPAWAQIRQYEQVGVPTPFPSVIGGDDIGAMSPPQSPMVAPAPVSAPPVVSTPVEPNYVPLNPRHRGK